MINLDAIEKDYYLVMVDEIKVSQHTKPLKAIARAQEEKAKNKDAYIYVKQPNIEPVVEITESAIVEELLAEIERLKNEYDMIWAEFERYKTLNGGTVVEPPLAAVKAFPTAEGYGKDTVGGRGGTVIRVTNLNDSGAGSFRAACEASGARIVIFDVGGRINLSSVINITNPFITIAGQHSVGDGITISIQTELPYYTNAAVSVLTNDVIIQYITFRHSVDYTEADVQQDSLRITSSSAYNVIVDHCSFSWGQDGNLDITSGAHDVTVQNCFLHQPTGSFNGHKNALNTYGAYNVTWYRNIFTNSRQRNPGISDGDNPNPVTGSYNFEVVNNYCYYHKWFTTFWFSGYTAKLNFINNVGRENGGDRRPLDINSSDVVGSDIQAYVRGNIDNRFRPTVTEPVDWVEEWSVTQGTSSATYAADVPVDYIEGTDGNYYRGDIRQQQTSPIALPLIVDSALIVDADVLMEELITTGGASLPTRDSEDAYVVEMIRSYETDYDKARIDIAYPQKRGSGDNVFPILASGTPLVSTLDDGIPDVWRAVNMNGELATDIAPSGYTWLEEYINSIN